MKIGGKFWDFCHFLCQFETFSIETLQLSLHKRLLENHFLHPLKDSTHEFCQHFNKKCIKSLKIGKLLVFLIFGVNLKHFHSENCNKFSGKAYWTTHSFLVDPLKHISSRNLSKLQQKVHKIFEKLKFFCHSRSQFETFSFRENAINSSEKPTGHKIFSLLTLFNVPILKSVEPSTKNASNFEN